MRYANADLLVQELTDLTKKLEVKWDRIDKYYKYETRYDKYRFVIDLTPNMEILESYYVLKDGFKLSIYYGKPNPITFDENMISSDVWQNFVQTLRYNYLEEKVKKDIIKEVITCIQRRKMDD